MCLFFPSLLTTWSHPSLRCRLFWVTHFWQVERVASMCTAVSFLSGAVSLGTVTMW